MLAGGIAHDVNNLLTAIMGYTELANGQAPEGSRLRGYLAEVVKASERARDVVGRILTFSRRGTIEPRPTELDDLVREALRLMRVSVLNFPSRMLRFYHRAAA